MIEHLTNVIRRSAKRWLAARGIAVERRPLPLLRTPSARLDVTFEHVLGRQLIHHPDLFFIQIGAFDGVSHDPIHTYVHRFGWHGVLVEPQARYMAALRQNYREAKNLTFRQVAVATERGPRALYKVRDDVPGLPPWAGELASFRRSTILSHASVIAGLEALIVEEIVECVTISDLFEEARGRRVDLLQIDAEGYDFEIIKGIDFARHRPEIIHFEHGHFDEATLRECLELLIENGYAVAMEERDTTACRRERLDATR